MLKGLELCRKLVVYHLTESVHVAGRHSSSKDKLWNVLADAFNDVSMDTTDTGSADNRCHLSLKTKVDTPTTYARPNGRKFPFKLTS